MGLSRRDTIAALVLLAFTGAAFWLSFDIQTRNDGTMRASVWPQTILSVMMVLGVVYLVQSLRGTLVESVADGDRPVVAGNWLQRYKNPILCLLLYFAFLATLPVLGVLIGGILLVFLTMTLIGGAGPRELVTHALVAAATIGGMWAIFTFALRVILPEGMILPVIIGR